MKLLTCSENLIKKYKDYRSKLMSEYNDDDYYDYDDYDVSEYMEKFPEHYLFVLGDDESFIDVIYTFNQKAFICISPFFKSTEMIEKEELTFLINHFRNKKVVFKFNDYVGFNLSEIGLIRCNLKSSFNESYNYVLSDSAAYYVSDNSFVNIIRDYIESNQTIDLSNISYQLFSNKEVQELLNQKRDEFYSGDWVSNSNSYVTIGFHYFNQHEPFDFYANDSWKWLLAFDNNRNIIGVIKYGFYDLSSSPHYGLNYIDVRQDCRERGIAKEMIKFLAKDFPTDHIFILSDESEMGQICKMGDHFKDTFKQLNPQVKIGFRRDFYNY